MLMAMSGVAAAAAEEPPARRCRVYQVSWKYRIGEAVRFGELAAIVLSRSRSMMGREIYEIWLMGPSAGRPVRIWAG